MHLHSHLIEALASQNRGGVRRHRARNHYFDKIFALVRQFGFLSTEKVRDKITKLQQNLLLTSKLSGLETCKLELRAFLKTQFS